MYSILHYLGAFFIGSRTWPPLHLDAVVAMRSESRAGPRAMAAVIFSFCFFEMLDGIRGQIETGIRTGRSHLQYDR
jgi:hypothetical protein